MPHQNVCTFPFGLPVRDRIPSIDTPRQAYLLGAYPSALHIFWRPPQPFPAIQAIAVDNEPDFFWNGAGEANLISQWFQQAGFSSAWGEVASAGKFNGSSGLWVDEKVLKPFQLTRNGTVWISDCLTTYRASVGISVRLEDTFIPFARQADLPIPLLMPHPSEAEIVQEAISFQQDRLQNELNRCQPDIIITLGNAALRVLQVLVFSKDRMPEKLSPDQEKYGKPVQVTLKSGKVCLWYPLAHPAAPQAYHQAHAMWIEQAKTG